MPLQSVFISHGFLHICTVFGFVLLGGKTFHVVFKSTKQIVPVPEAVVDATSASDSFHHQL